MLPIGFDINFATRKLSIATMLVLEYDKAYPILHHELYSTQTLILKKK